MQEIVSYPNPYTNSDVNIAAQKRNAITQKVALVVLGIGLFIAIGAGIAAINAATFYALPIILAGVIVAATAYKVFTFLRDINKPLPRENFGWTRLHKAAAKGQVMMTKLLLFLGANPNEKANGDTPLHMACFEANKPSSEAHIKVMDLLVKAKADVNAVGNWGRCPLHYALEARHIDRVKFLVQQGAYINLKQSCHPDWSPWEYSQNRNPEVFSMMSSDPRPKEDLLEADKLIDEILKTGSVYHPPLV